MADQKITLGDIYNVVNRLEDKLEKRLIEDEKRIDAVEISASETKTKVGNFAIFQIAFSTIIGAIATYLGARK